MTDTAEPVWLDAYLIRRTRYQHRTSHRPCTVVGTLDYAERGYYVFIDGTAGNTTRLTMMPAESFHAVYEPGEGVPYEGDPSDGN